MDMDKTLDANYFKDVYDANDDPWDFETSEYEAGKYRATLAALPREKYGNALEIGCSIGVLTRMLADRCAQLLATDVAQKALEKAMARCKDLRHVRFERQSFPAELPHDAYDLIMVSEVAYYLSAGDWSHAMDELYARLLPEGHIVLVHWLPVVPDYPQTGDEVHDRFAGQMEGRMNRVFNRREENYRIDVWEKAG